WAAQSSPPHVPSPLPASNGSSTRVAPVGGVGPTAEGKVPWRSDGDGRAMSRRVGALSGHGKGCHLFPDGKLGANSDIFMVVQGGSGSTGRNLVVRKCVSLSLKWGGWNPKPMEDDIITHKPTANNTTIVFSSMFISFASVAVRNSIV
ncbi:hypothetical protein BHE74_00025240, partial [Ensete ventricosum]